LRLLAFLSLFRTSVLWSGRGYTLFSLPLPFFPVPGFTCIQSPLAFGDSSVSSHPPPLLFFSRRFLKILEPTPPKEFFFVPGVGFFLQISPFPPPCFDSSLPLPSSVYSPSFFRQIRLEAKRTFLLRAKLEPPSA